MALYNEGLSHGSARYAANVIKCALLTAAYTVDVDHDAFASVSGNELGTAGTGYTAGGIALGTKATTVDDTNDIVHDTAADVAFGALNSGSIRYAVIYDETADLLIRVIDFGTTRTLNGGTVTLRFTNNRVRSRQAA